MQEAKPAQFEGLKYLSLETFRKNGQGVPTPVWFVESQGVLYVRTVKDSGKVKRLRNNCRTRVAPCDANGNLLGDWVDSQAFLVTDQQTAAQVNRWFNRKYGLIKTAFDFINLLRQTKWTTIGIELT